MGYSAPAAGPKRVGATVAGSLPQTGAQSKRLLAQGAAAPQKPGPRGAQARDQHSQAQQKEQIMMQRSTQLEMDGKTSKLVHFHFCYNSQEKPC